MREPFGVTWFKPPARNSDLSSAAEALRRADPILGRVIERVGPCTLSPRRDYFVALCKAIFSQQLSTKVAAVLFGRFCDLFPARRPTPQRVLELFKKDPEALRGCGLSRQKTAYLLDLAEHFAEGRIDTRRLARLEDEQVIAALTAVKGIGRWTAEMFLMFVLNRLDVLPVDDLGLREGVREIYQLSKRPTPTEVIERGERWRPYRSIATWYIWRRTSGGLVESAATDPTPGIALLDDAAKEKSPPAKVSRAAKRSASSPKRTRSAATQQRGIRLTRRGDLR